MTDTLPPGVHPHDSSQPWDQHGNAPVPLDYARPPANRGHKAWETANGQALPVFQRLGRNWSTGVYVVSSASFGSGSIRVAQRRPGRTRLTLWVPSSYFPSGGALTTTPAGVIIAEDEGVVQQNEGAPLFIGDAVDISSEGAVYAGYQPGTTTGVVAFIDCWDAEAASDY